MIDRKILQIIPAEGWWVVVDSGQEPIRMRLTCWALAQKEDGSTEIAGMYAGEDFVGCAEENIDDIFKYEYVPPATH